jgi:riboflavin transporter FmnP
MNPNFKYGLYIAATLIGYFLLIDLLGLADKIWLSFFNAIITGACLFLAVRDVYQHEKEQFKYMEGFIAALVSGFIGTVIFTIFIAIYLFEIDTELAASLQEQITIAGSGIEVAILLFVFLSGIATTITSALVILPIYKQSWNTKRVRREQKPMNDKH